MEALFDITNPQPIVDASCNASMDALFDVTQEPVVIVDKPAQPLSPVRKKPKLAKVFDVNRLVQCSNSILDGNFKAPLSHRGFRVLGSDPDRIEAYQQCTPPISLSYEPYDYQKESSVLIDRMFNNDDPSNLSNILISSPTGSGKTHLIKWAAARAIEYNQFVVICVPLVALAEQIFGELSHLFRPTEQNPVLGIHTGPTEKFTDATNVLICTFEIVTIRMHMDPSWLQGSPVMVMDEVHFVQDPERGCQLESIILNLPPETSLIALSGTIPNAKQFAKHMVKATLKDTTVLGLKKRPIRLRYYAHLGGKLTEICYNEEGTITQRWKQKAWSWVQKQLEKRPDRLNRNQTRGRILQLAQDLKQADKFPAMIVSFSCNGLDSLGAQLNSIDLIEESARKSYVHRQFTMIEKMVPEDEWPLFLGLRDMAKRGIAVHHSRQPKPYLEILPGLVKKGFIKLVLATSTLSTGIDLPMRSVVLLSFMQPRKGGFKPIEPSLLFQIFGRAGRPGLETSGHAIIACWQKPDERVDVKKLMCSSAAPVIGHGMVRPRQVLSYKIFHKSVKELLFSPFSSNDFDHVYPVLEECEEALTAESEEVHRLVLRMAALEQLRDMTDKHATLMNRVVSRARKGDVVYIDPERNNMVPSRWTVTSYRPLKVKEFSKVVPPAWVLACSPCRWKKVTKEEHDVLQDIHRLAEELCEEEEPKKDKVFRRAMQVCLLQRNAADMKAMVSVEAHPLHDEYLDLVRKLTDFNFLDKHGLVTIKGRIVPLLIGCEDPITLVEAWMKNVLPRDHPIAFSVALTCFLQNKRHRQPKDKTGVYERLCELQAHIGEVGDLGTSMMEPIRMWLDGSCVNKICNQLQEASPGHVCKTVQRLIQLLAQIQEASYRMSDPELEVLCDQSIRLATRGLPFVPSIVVG